jgi:hypothetical protein
MAEWHAFAKLRIHTETTLDHVEKLTKEFGVLMRQFHGDTCSHFQTTKLPQEAAARRQQELRAQAKQSIHGRYGLSPTAGTPDAALTCIK